MKTMLCSALAVLLAAGPVFAQKDIARDVEAAAFKQLAAAIPLGSRVKLQVTGGRRMTATLMAVRDDAMIVQRVSRVPEPAVTIAYTDLLRLEREQKGGFTVGKAIGIGLAAGAGAILTLFAIMVSIGD
jgi:hypothetical protein